MSRTLHEQVANRCIHFNGIMNKECEAGVKYEDVRIDKPYKFPCLKQGGECSKVQFLTEAEVDKEVEELGKVSLAGVAAYVKIKKHYEKTKQQTGSLDCECGGELKYSVAQLNGHVWAKCNKCSISIIE